MRTDIVGYTYNAENYLPDSLIETLITKGMLAPGARGMSTEEALDQAAAIDGIDRYDERSFDSGDFPKVIFSEQLTTDDLEWMGWDALPGTYADGGTFVDILSGPFAGERVEEK